MSKKTISPAKERDEKKAIESRVKSDLPKRRGVSAPQAVFLSLLTYVMLAAGAFAFRDQLAPYIQEFMGDSVESTVETTLSSTLPAFVPVPAASAVPEFDTSQQDKAIADLNDEMAALRTQLSQLSVASSSEGGATVAAAPSAAIVSELESFRGQLAEIDSLRNQLTELQNRPAPEPVFVGAEDSVNSEQLVAAQVALDNALSKISQLETKLAENSRTMSQLVEQSQQPSEMTNVRGLIAFQNLQSQALSGQPFQTSLQRVIALAGDVAAVQEPVSALEKLAPHGRIQLAELQQLFADATSQFMQQETTQNDDSFMGKVKGNLTSFVRIRRTDENASDTDAVITLVENALKRGDVKTAYLELLKVEDGKRAAYKDWLANAKSYYQLPEWLNALQLHITADSDSNA